MSEARLVRQAGDYEKGYTYVVTALTETVEMQGGPLDGMRQHIDPTLHAVSCTRANTRADLEWSTTTASSPLTFDRVEYIRTSEYTADGTRIFRLAE